MPGVTTATGGAAHWRWNPRVSSRTLDGTAFVLHKGAMVSLNAVGSFIWDAFREGATVATVAARVAAHFDVTLARAADDTATFVDALLARGLLIADAANSSSSHPDGPPGS